MTDSLPQLETKRTDLFRQLAAVGDFRRGSITATSGKCGKPKFPRPTGPGPRNGGITYKPTTTFGSIPQPPNAFIYGITNEYGDIVIEQSLSKSDKLATLYHEQVHQFLTPKLYFLRNIRIQVAMEGYNRSYILRYLEEVLAQTAAELRTKGIKGSPEGVSFPVKNGYVTVAKMGKEAAGILLGPINVVGNTYRVFFSTGRKK